MFINDIYDVVTDLSVTMKLLANDAKKYNELDLGLSNDLYTACDRIKSWAENWQMRRTTNECTAALRIINKTSHYATSTDHYILEKEHLN
jgi:hypothetical protein